MINQQDEQLHDPRQMRLESILSQIERPDLTNFCAVHYVNTQSKFIDDCYELQLSATPLMSKSSFMMHYVSHGSEIHTTYAKQFEDYYFGRSHKPKYQPFKPQEIKPRHWGELDIEQSLGGQ